MRKEYEAVQNAKSSAADEIKALKDRMMLGGAARNRMLVKGGSSFNALVRAMKQVGPLPCVWFEGVLVLLWFEGVLLPWVWFESWCLEW